jgi:hypothetical protein
MYILIAIIIILTFLVYNSKEFFGFCYKMYLPSKSIKTVLTSYPKEFKQIQDKKCMLDSMFINNNIMYLPNDAPNTCAGINRV